MAIIAGGAIVLTVWPAVEAARHATCQGQMYYLYGAIRNYHAEHGHFPPAFVAGPDGTPWHSWRVLLLPYLEEDIVYQQYRFDEPWNGPNNSKLADRISLQVFQCPSGPNCDRTLFADYCVVTGAGKAFPGSETSALKNVLNSRSKTIVLVEVANSDIHWMEPRDLALDDLFPTTGPRLGSPHPLGVSIVRANRKYECLDLFVDRQTLKEQFQLRAK